MEKIFLEGAEGAKLAVNIYEPAEPTGIVMVFHGMAEHKERYDYTMNKLMEAGYVAAISDMRGHGESLDSTGVKGYFGKGGIDNIVKDYKQITDYLKERYPGLPLFILGHSMGTLNARTYLEKYSGETNRVALSGTVCPNPASKIAVWIAKSQAKKLGLTGFSPIMLKLTQMGTGGKPEPGQEFQWLSYNQENIKTYEADPDSGFPFMVGGYLSLFEMTTNIAKPQRYQNVNKDCRILLISGVDDPVTGGAKGLAASQANLEKAGFTVENKVYDHMKHEILNEDDRDTVIRDIVDFFRS
ncbi:MAG: alpha/beta hydrolase [Firmicutes bacterium]|nr:alpha/beta hydrolase [Bacillota bacterium]